MWVMEWNERSKNDQSWRLPAPKWVEVREKLAFLAGEDIDGPRLCVYESAADRAMWTDDDGDGDGGGARGRYVKTISSKLKLRWKRGWYDRSTGDRQSGLPLAINDQKRKREEKEECFGCWGCWKWSDETWRRPARQQTVNTWGFWLLQPQWGAIHGGRYSRRYIRVSKIEMQVFWAVFQNFVWE